MSKIICEVCGTSYPETAAQCPICGCVRSGDAAAAAENAAVTEEGEVRTYTYVKGGRFSKSNVKKRSRNAEPVAEEIPYEESPDPEEYDEDLPAKEKTSMDKWLTVTAIVLLLAIIAVVAYIAVKFFGVGVPVPSETSSTTTEPTSQTTTETSETTTEPEEIPCQNLSMENTTITLEKAGAAALLNVYTQPEDTTDLIFYSSSDESVATVTDSGKVVAVGPGEATITVTCGEVTMTCLVKCTEPEETTEPSTEPTTEPATEPTTAPTTEPTTAPTEPENTFKLNTEDFTLFGKGDSWVVYNGSISHDLITWSSDNPEIATVENGKVVAVSSGWTYIRGEFEGKKVKCIVRCRVEESETTPTEPSETTTPTEPSETAPAGNAVISHEDVTIKRNETFTLTLKDEDGKPVTVTWHVTDSSVCTVSGSKVTGVAAGNSKVYTTYGGKEYSCIVRVSG